MRQPAIMARGTSLSRKPEIRIGQSEMVRRRGLFCRLGQDRAGSMVVEAAFALPLLITLMIGIVSYGIWLMAAHSVQEAANHAARAAIAGINQAERDSLVDASLDNGLLANGTVDAERVTVTTSLDGAYYTVSIRYDAANSGIFASGLIPLPDEIIERDAVVRLSAF